MGLPKPPKEVQMFLRREHLAALVVAVSLAASTQLAYAQVDMWQLNGVPLCAAVGSQVGPTIVTDGAGGAIITWDDNRSGAYATYAQRVNAAGVAQWTPDGVAISTGQGSRSMTDGAGGAIVTYAKTSSSGARVYAHHVLASGAVDPAWPARGGRPGPGAGPGGGSDVTEAARAATGA